MEPYIVICSYLKSRITVARIHDFFRLLLFQTQHGVSGVGVQETRVFFSNRIKQVEKKGENWFWMVRQRLLYRFKEPTAGINVMLYDDRTNI